MKKHHVFFSLAKTPKTLEAYDDKYKTASQSLGDPWKPTPLTARGRRSLVDVVGGKVWSRGEQWGAGGEKGVGLSVVNLEGPGFGKNGLELKGFFVFEQKDWVEYVYVYKSCGVFAC